MRSARAISGDLEIMRKRISLLLIVVLAFIVAITLVACNKSGAQYVDGTPSQIGGSDIDIPATEVDGGKASIKFIFKELSSVFHSIDVETFDISDVQYQIVYTNTSTSLTEAAPVTLDMVNEADRPLLSKAGHHTIRVTAKYKDVNIAGAFALHLKAASQPNETVTLTFNLNNPEATAGFGETKNGVTTVKVDRGVSFTWNEFLYSFRVSHPSMAIANVSYRGATQNETFGPESTGKLQINGNTTFTLNWTGNVINVKFDLNLPQGQTLNVNVPDQRPARNTGKLIRPDSETINVLDGYYFAGWYTQDGEPWIFTSSVGSSDFTLYAHWTERMYSFSVYTMGGTFKDEIASSLDNGTEINLENAETLGYKIIESSVTFDLYNNVTRISFSGMNYKTNYEDYVALVTVVPAVNANTPAQTVVMKVTDLLSNLQRNDGVYEAKGYSTEITCENTVGVTGEVTRDLTTYVKWTLSASALSDPAKMGEYYRDYAYASADGSTKGYVIKADGSLAITKIYDYYVNKVVIPDSIVLEDGNAHPISEISKNAFVNTLFLTEVDMSAAEHLTTIGEGAFSNCPNLKTMTLPQRSAISSVGKNAFANTEWEDKYSQTHGGNDYIVFGNSLYKYVGANVAEIDLTDKINSVDIISDSAFSSVTNLEKIKLSSNIVRINDNAFANLPALKHIEIEDENSLSYIGNNAFSGCSMFMSGTDKSGQALPNNKNGAIIIGSVFFRYVNTSATTYTMPSGIKHIAPKAFDNCLSLATINFTDDSTIESVGENAFEATAWIKKNNNAATDSKTYVRDGFVVINGILAEFYSEDIRNRDIVVPQNVTRIVSHAFGNFARSVVTIQIGSNVKYIEERAFAGINDPESIIFSDFGVTDGVLTGVTDIAPNAFGKSGGVQHENLKLYFSKAVIDHFVNNAISATDRTDWYDLYVLNSEKFDIETITSIRINPQAMGNATLIKSGASSSNPDKDKQNALWDTYPSGKIERGLMLQSSTGIVRYETLDFENNKVHIDESDANSVITFKYNDSSDNCHGFTCTVVFAIKDAPKFYESSVFPEEDVERKVIDGSTLNESNSTFWIAGFIGDVPGASIPTFFTSHTSLDNYGIKFVYKDISYKDGSSPLREITTAITHTNFSPNTALPEQTVEFTINFYGLGTYRISMKYKAVTAKVAEIIQNDPVSVPINANAYSHITTSSVTLRREDGTLETVVINNSNFKATMVDGEPITNSRTDILATSLGFHSITLEYTHYSDSVNGKVAGDIVYSVILEADLSLYSFDIISGKARISALSTDSDAASRASNAEELVLPNTYTVKNADGTTSSYDVTRIAAGVFKNLKNLKRVYLPSTMEFIGKEAFEGCTSLERVYNARATVKEQTDISDDNFRIMEERIDQYGTINVSAIDFGSGLAAREFIVPRYVTLRNASVIKTVEGENGYGYTSTTTVYAEPVFAENVFASYDGTVYLYDTEYNRNYAQQHLASFGERVKFYTDSDGGIRPASQNRLTFDRESVKITNSVVSIDRKLVSLKGVQPDTVTVNYETKKLIVVDYVYSKTEGNTVTNYYTVGAESNLALDFAVSPDMNFDIYMPDSIFDAVTLEDANGNDVEINVFKHDSDYLFEVANFLPRRLQFIGIKAFYGCSKLESIDVSMSEERLNYIGAMAFAGTNIKTIDLSSTSIETVNNQMFEDCTSLVEVILPETIRYIGDSAFRHCGELTTITGYDKTKLEEVSENAFIQCDKLVDRPTPNA